MSSTPYQYINLSINRSVLFCFVLMVLRSACAIYEQTASVWYMIPMGFATATSTMIGNSLGSGSTRDPVTLAKIGIAICAIYGVFNGAFFLIALRYPWVSLFSNDQVMNYPLHHHDE
jgi:Na+-driven multidrug efflux pump